MSETPETPGQDNSVIRELRAKANQFDSLQSRFTELEGKFTTLESEKTALEREKMGEFERLQAELKDKDSTIKNLTQTVGELHPLTEKVKTFSATFESLYQSKLSAVPDDYRPKVETLSSTGDWPDRLKALEAAVSLIPMGQEASTGRSGQPSGPGGIGSPGKPQAPSLKEIGANPAVGWAAAFKDK